MAKPEMYSAAILSLDSAAKSVDKTFLNTVVLRQSHTSTAVYVDNFSFMEYVADGVVSKNPKLLLCLRTADCAPILLEDKENQIVGAAHAGWRGALSGILESTISLMINNGARVENIFAHIGPMLMAESFECGLDMYNEFINKNESFSEYFVPGKIPDKKYFNLNKFIIDKLKNLGIKNITFSKDNTYTSADYFSYRRDMQKDGKYEHSNLSFIGLDK
ncbi:MAG: peptidoglycan editing factor PgeF [Rickettsiales bacterium]|jgi:YfiH family protein|nr:peptidoglycan editing factor PgeF [Rickettsiales bacterium]